MTRTLRNALILLLALAFAPPLLARDASSLDNAVRQAREKSNGRVISAETQEKNGRQYYNIRILTDDGKVRRYRFDAGNDRRSNKRR
ncbi:MAG: ribosome biogenesis GTPase RsgA [Candidatus Thiodiazotropha sp.]